MNLKPGQKGMKKLVEAAGRLKAEGGRWNPEKQLWYVRYGKISGTTLEKHIHIDDSG